MAGQQSGQEGKQAFFLKSAEAYRTALRLKPNDPAYWGNYAIAAGKAGQIDEARAATETAVKLDPANAGRSYFNLGAILSNASRYNEALAAFQMVPEGSPQFTKAQAEAADIREKYIFQSISDKLKNPAFASTLNTYVKSSGVLFQDLRSKELARVESTIVWDTKLSLPGAQACGILKDPHQTQLSCTLNTSQDKDQLRADYQQLAVLVRNTLPMAWTLFDLDPEPEAGPSCRFSSGHTEVWVSVNHKQSSYELDLSVVAYPSHAAR
jgi:tetratricopeptide (TPR) repeat protein